jgi:hypothetical protein
MRMQLDTMLAELLLAYSMACAQHIHTQDADMLTCDMLSAMLYAAP